MNYPDARQDTERGIPGLFEKLESTVPKMVKQGYDCFAFGSMLMVDNMHDAEPLIRLAHRWGINIAFSGYNDMKNGNQSHFVAPEKMAEFRRVCARIKELKRELGNVMTSDYFFDTLPTFYEKRDLPGCQAGKIMVHVTPKGMIQPCAELPEVAHYKDFSPKDYPGPNCGKCFDACVSPPGRRRNKAHAAPLDRARRDDLTGEPRTPTTRLDRHLGTDGSAACARGRMVACAACSAPRRRPSMCSPPSSATCSAMKPVEVAKNLAGASPWSVLACVASSFVMLALQSFRWHTVMGPLLGLSYGQACRAQVVGMMFNAIIPARGGDLLRVQYLGRRTGKSRATILGTEIVDRWLDWWGWIPVILLIALVTDLPRWVFTAVAIFGGALASWGVGMIVLTRRGVAPRPGSRFGGVYDAPAATGVGAFQGKRTIAIALLIAPLPWLWEAFVLSQVSKGFGIDIDLAKAFCVLIGFNLATVVPSPGSIGTVEAGGTAALVFFGVDKSRALAFMFVYHFSQLLPGIMTGVAVLVSEGERLFGRAPAPEPTSPVSPP